MEPQTPPTPSSPSANEPKDTSWPQADQPPANHSMPNFDTSVAQSASAASDVPQEWAMPPVQPTAPVPPAPAHQPSAPGVFQPGGMNGNGPAPGGMGAPEASASGPYSQPAGYMQGGSPQVMGMVAQKRKKPLIIGCIAGLLVLVLLAASASAYYVVNKPQNVLGMALANSFASNKIQSDSFDGSVELQSGSGPALTATFNGAASQSGAFTLSGSVDAVVTNITLDMRSTDGATYYFKVGGLQGLPQLLNASGDATNTQLAPIIGSLNDQWIEINQSIIQQLTGKDSQVNFKLSDADRAKLAGAYKKNQFMVVQQKLADESIKGKPSFHYKVVIDAAKLKSFAAALKAANLDSIKITQDQLSSFNKTVNDAQFSKYPFDVWVAKSGRLIDQLTVAASQNGSTIKMRITVDDYNKPVNVEKPAGAKSLLDVLGGLFTSGLLPTGRQGGAGSSIDLGNGISL